MIHFYVRLKIDLQISMFSFSHELLVFSKLHQENVKSKSYTPFKRKNVSKYDILEVKQDMKSGSKLTMCIYQKIIIDGGRD